MTRFWNRSKERDKMPGAGSWVDLHNLNIIKSTNLISKNRIHSEEYKNYADFFRSQIRKVFENLTLFAENELLKFQLKQKDREIETLIKTKNLELEEKDRTIEELQKRLLERTIVPESSENDRKGHLKNFNRVLELLFTDDWETTPERVKLTLRPKIMEKIFQLTELMNRALKKLENEETNSKGDQNRSQKEHVEEV